MKTKYLIVVLLLLSLLLPAAIPFNPTANKPISGILKVTLEHPFLVNGEWIPAKDLKVGDILKTIDGKKVVILEIEEIETKEPFPVYNLEAGTYHNFVLGDGIVVHNSNQPRIPIGICFSGDIPILMADGSYKPIKDILAGDEVMSYDFVLNATVISTVGNVSVSIANYVYTINDKIRVTGDHPFYTKEAGWASINSPVRQREGIWPPTKLAEGYHLMEYGGEFVEVTSIKPVFGLTDVYNLVNVKGNNNFFAHGYLVHNTCEALPLWMDMPGKRFKSVIPKPRPAILKAEFESAFPLTKANFKEGINQYSKGKRYFSCKDQQTAEAFVKEIMKSEGLEVEWTDAATHWDRAIKHLARIEGKMSREQFREYQEALLEKALEVEREVYSIEGKGIMPGGCERFARARYDIYDSLGLEADELPHINLEVEGWGNKPKTSVHLIFER